MLPDFKADLVGPDAGYFGVFDPGLLEQGFFNFKGWMARRLVPG